jgi:hypothetical protein
VDAIVDAMEWRPDLVICAGHALVDALALVTASHLEQQFLVVGAQLPESTVNVTAAIWRGASSRGREVAATAASFDGMRSHPSTWTPPSEPASPACCTTSPALSSGSIETTRDPPVTLRLL